MNKFVIAVFIPPNNMSDCKKKEDGEMIKVYINMYTYTEEKVTDYDGKIIKITSVADGAVPKTAFLISFVTNSYPEEYVPTVLDNCDTTHIVDGVRYTISLVDTAGQEDYDEIRQMSYEDVDVILVCFSVDNRDSLKNVQEKWVPEIRNHCPKNPVLMVGLSSHLEWKVTEYMINNIRETTGCVESIVCSEKTSYNLHKVFDLAIESYLRYEKGDNLVSSTTKKSKKKYRKKVESEYKKIKKEKEKRKEKEKKEREKAEKRRLKKLSKEKRNLEEKKMKEEKDRERVRALMEVEKKRKRKEEALDRLKNPIYAFEKEFPLEDVNEEMKKFMTDNSFGKGHYFSFNEDSLEKAFKNLVNRVIIRKIKDIELPPSEKGPFLKELLHYFTEKYKSTIMVGNGSGMYFGEINNIFKAHGFGCLFRKVGKKKYQPIYYGMFKKGRRNGHGTEYKFQKGSISYKSFKGDFVNDYRHGKGIEFDFLKEFGICQQTFEGTYSFGKRHGRGEEYHPKTGKTKRGNWVEGELDETSVLRYDCPLVNYHVIKKHLQDSRLKGQGGFGSVYQMKTSFIPGMKEQVKEKFVAVKIIKVGSSAIREDIFRKTRRGISLCYSLKSPHILQTYGIVRGAHEVGYVMELCDVSVDILIRRSSKANDDAESKLDLNEKIRILFETARGMSDLHKNLVMHRDLKWANVMIDFKKNIKLTDFDTLKEDEQWRMLTVEQSSRIGTPGFLAPEVFLGRKYSLKCDVYAFGLMIYSLLWCVNVPYLTQFQCFCGTPMNNIFRSNSLDYHVSNCNLRPLLDPKEVKKFPSFLVDLMVQCWDKNPFNRPSFQDIVFRMNLENEKVFTTFTLKFPAHKGVKDQKMFMMRPYLLSKLTDWIEIKFGNLQSTAAEFYDNDERKNDFVVTDTKVLRIDHSVLGSIMDDDDLIRVIEKEGSSSDNPVLQIELEKFDEEYVLHHGEESIIDKKRTHQIPVFEHEEKMKKSVEKVLEEQGELLKEEKERHYNLMKLVRSNYEHDILKLVEEDERKIEEIEALKNEVHMLESKVNELLDLLPTTKKKESVIKVEDNNNSNPISVVLKEEEEEEEEKGRISCVLRYENDHEEEEEIGSTDENNFVKVELGCDEDSDTIHIVMYGIISLENEKEDEESEVLNLASKKHEEEETEGESDDDDDVGMIVEPESESELQEKYIERERFEINFKKFFDREDGDGDSSFTIDQFFKFYQYYRSNYDEKQTVEISSEEDDMKSEEEQLIINNKKNEDDEDEEEDKLEFFDGLDEELIDGEDDLLDDLEGLDEIVDY